MFAGQTTEYGNGMERRNAQLDRCLAGIAAGDIKGVEELYRATSAAVYSFALSILQNPHDAQDVLQDTYLRICGGAANYRSERKPMAWILTITKNLCVQKMREQRKECWILPECWEDSFAEQSTLSAEDRLIVRECLTRLNDQEQQIVVLHAVAGFKHREIARMLELPLSTVLSKYNRAIKKLRKQL